MVWDLDRVLLLNPKPLRPDPADPIQGPLESRSTLGASRVTNIMAPYSEYSYSAVDLQYTSRMILAINSAPTAGTRFGFWLLGFTA